MKNFGMKRSAGNFNSFAINMDALSLVAGGSKTDNNGGSNNGQQTRETSESVPPVGN